VRPGGIVARRLTARLVVGALAAAVLCGGAGVAGVAAPCAESEAAAILLSPRAPGPGARLRVLAAADAPLDAVLAVDGPDGERLAATSERRGGPPFWWYVEIDAAPTGAYRATLVAGANVLACREVSVGAASPRRPDPVHVWPVTREWTRGAENLYAAWIDKLFDAPLEDEPSWHVLHEITRAPERNALHDHLGLGEDDADGLRLEPDCADLPYFLRAYFAWKLGLPFGYSECSRGAGGTPPRCGRWHSNLDAPAAGTGGDERARMQAFFARTLAWVVQSGAGRASAESNRTDFYPIGLGVHTLRPGTVYADPYGHTLILVRRVPQTATTGGRLLAVDAQPDGTVARKRYWRGNFLFAIDPSLGSAGFKRFRPIVRDGAGLRPLGNAEIGADPRYGDYSLEQYAHGVDGFYDRVDDVASPAPLDPERAFRETIDALDEQIRTRIRSVSNGEAYVATHRGTIPMPDGAAIFETTGAWEDFATPSRDLRLLIAIDVVRAFPAEVARRPERFELPAGASADRVRAQLDETVRRESATRTFTYVRSDGSSWSLTLGDVLARAEALEVAYDPNDCVETRWGAPAGSAEASTCTRRSPADQRARLAQNRVWFHERRRPPR
jgi:hypothetical protein